MTIITENHKKLGVFIKIQKRYLIFSYFNTVIYYQLESLDIILKLRFMFLGGSFIHV